MPEMIISRGCGGNEMAPAGCRAQRLHTLAMGVMVTLYCIHFLTMLDTHGIV
jgi:hypothetical protein